MEVECRVNVGPSKGWYIRLRVEWSVDGGRRESLAVQASNTLDFPADRSTLFPRASATAPTILLISCVLLIFTHLHCISSHQHIFIHLCPRWNFHQASCGKLKQAHIILYPLISAHQWFTHSNINMMGDYWLSQVFPCALLLLLSTVNAAFSISYCSSQNTGSGFLAGT